MAAKNIMVFVLITLAITPIAATSNAWSADLEAAKKTCFARMPHSDTNPLLRISGWKIVPSDEPRDRYDVEIYYELLNKADHWIKSAMVCVFDGQQLRGVTRRTKLDQFQTDEPSTDE